MGGLRQYQTDCLSAIVQADAEGCRSQLVILPTGTGKTRIASNLPQAINMRPCEAMAFVVAQEELAFQALADLKECNPSLNVSLEKAEHHNDVNADVVVASIDTLARSEQRLEQFANMPWRIIFLDECHGAVAPKYLKVLKALQVLKGEPDRELGRLLIGLTATPKRFDGIALGRIFDKIVFRKGIREMIAAGWIVDPVAYRIETGVDLDGVKMHQRDFATGELSHVMNTPELNALVVKKYLEYGAGLPAIAFTVDIKHSNDLADVFRHHGISFEAISSDTPKSRRKELVEAHKNMEVIGLSSCQALLTGFDSPPATVALFARPTCSGLLYTQALGRVLRRFPSPENAPGHVGYTKRSALILDFVGASAKHRLFTASTLFGLSPQFDPKGKSVTKTLSEMEELQRSNPTLDISAYSSLAEIQAASTSVDLWKPVPIPKLAKTCSKFIWMQVGDDVYRLSAPGMAVFIEQNHLGHYEVYRRLDKSEPDSLIQFDDAEDAFSYADGMVPDESVPLIRADARWRKDAPKEAQACYLWRLDPVVRKRFSSGDAFFRYALYQFQRGNSGAFSKGAISLRIEMSKRGKEKAART